MLFHERLCIFCTVIQTILVAISYSVDKHIPQGPIVQLIIASGYGSGYRHCFQMYYFLTRLMVYYYLKLRKKSGNYIDDFQNLFNIIKITGNAITLSLVVIYYDGYQKS